MSAVRVRAETPMLGLNWGAETTLERSPLVDAAIAEGRLTVLDGDGDATPLRGDALDDALSAAGLPTSGSADDKRARLAAHRAAQARAAAGPGEDEPLGPQAAGPTAAPPVPAGAPAVPAVATPAPRSRRGGS